MSFVDSEKAFPRLDHHGILKAQKDPGVELKYGYKNDKNIYESSPAKIALQKSI